PAQQRLRVKMERAGRKGKTVTLVEGFVGTEEDLKELAKNLKTKLSTGGSAKDGEIVIQGDVRQRVAELLRAFGYSQTKG
ncbi:MAG: translation initiation factor, partial [Bacteroidaceae bacterium]|nr:translation initiation factor [Bacteroidaceae bacterium]